MASSMVIINGIKFPYFLVDRAVAYARESGTALQALFVAAGSEIPESYIFPSDIDAATDMDDTEKDSAAILRHQMKFFIDILRGQKVAGSAELLKDPALEQVLEKTQSAGRLFLAPGFEDLELLAITRFTLQELAEQATCPVEIVPVTANA